MLEFDAKIEAARVVPTFPADAAELTALEGKTVRAVLRTGKSRSSPQNRKFWAFAAAIADNLPEDWPTLSKDNVVELLKIETGHAVIFQDAMGQYRRASDSISFEAMSHEAFGTFMDVARNAACRVFGYELAQAAWGETQ